MIQQLETKHNNNLGNRFIWDGRTKYNGIVIIVMMLTITRKDIIYINNKRKKILEIPIIMVTITRIVIPIIIIVIDSNNENQNANDNDETEY